LCLNGKYAALGKTKTRYLLAELVLEAVPDLEAELVEDLVAPLVRDFEEAPTVEVD
jgi:hypothetical protein